jgi:uncharacterized damage-inducible protein DinB
LPDASARFIVGGMFRTTEDFLQTWDVESKSTARVLGALSDESLSQSAGPKGYMLGSLANHVTNAALMIPAHAGLWPTPAKLPELKDVADIVAAYDRAAKHVADEVPRKWNDALLAEEIPCFGKTMARGPLLAALVAHQCHHRAQMTVLMRLVGLKVPGVYGPSESDMAAMAEPK